MTADDLIIGEHSKDKKKKLETELWDTPWLSEV